jgi:hypothetical protein
MRYPCSATSDAAGEPKGQPLPPWSGPVTREIWVCAVLMRALWSGRPGRSARTPYRRLSADLKTVSAGTRPSTLIR